MSRIAACYFGASVVYLLTGMIWGSFIGAYDDSAVAPAHAHLALLGWLGMAVYGTFYALVRETPTSRKLAWTQFVVSNTGLFFFIPAFAMILRGDLAYVPMDLTGESLSILGAILFGVSVLREILRPRGQIKAHLVKESFSRSAFR